MEDLEFFNMLEEAAKVNTLVKSVIISAEETIRIGKEEIQAQKKLAKDFQPFLVGSTKRKYISPNRADIVSFKNDGDESSSSLFSDNFDDDGDDLMIDPARLEQSTKQPESSQPG
ncbi:hypothetical protein BLNAU_4668 [Blattamonas nauphoetae]|uniref:Uncharacterized protein n=1 Tax=Blattamonas nauphoetae TaxID=2049346 RepID=A0ABQ9Y9N4_9EUKA|nr:hypothetical protein BLNAU_4668 [Blattamonas nauphoetae]